MKRIYYSLLVVAGAWACGFAQVPADSLEQSLSAAVQKQQSVCCLPVMEHLKSKEGKFYYDKETRKPIELGFCYEDQNGFVAARIGNDELRTYANRHVDEYPVCQDAFCSLGNDFVSYYVRADEAGKPLAQGKFELDNVGFLNSQEELKIRIPRKIQRDKLRWTGEKTVPPCSRTLEEVLPVCVVKRYGPDRVEFADAWDVSTDMEKGNIRPYIAFSYYEEDPEHLIKSPVDLNPLVQAGVLKQVTACRKTMLNRLALEKMGISSIM